MESQNYLEQIASLRATLEKLPPATKEQQDKLWKKFRLEWNYNSNHIEGNTLTYGQTELLLIFDKATGEKDLREYEEMKAHDLAIKMVIDEANDLERPLTENFIRLLNEKILVRPFWKEAITADGQSTRREIQIGQYKSMPNSVRLANGEIFPYASPQETPGLMNDLVSWYNSQKDMDAVTLAAMVHYRFVCIHPFDDGNGRVARLLMNYVLLKNGFPPVIIQSDDKANYLLALNKADTGDLKAFVDYIAAQVLWSLDLAIKAAKGESVEETHDWKKDLELLKRTLPKDNDVTQRKNPEVVQKIARQVLDTFFFNLRKELSSFDSMFLEGRNYLEVSNANQIRDNLRVFEVIPHINEGTSYLKQTISWKGFAKGGINTFTIHVQVQCDFEEYKYSISYLDDKSFRVSKLYSESLTPDEQDEIIAKVAKGVMAQINQNLQSN